MELLLLLLLSLLKIAILFVCIFICLYVYSNVVYYANPLSKIPCRPCSILIGSYKEYIENDCRLLDFIKQSSRQLGSVRSSRIFFGGIRLIVTDPFWIKHVLTVNSRNYVRGRFMGGEDLFVAVGRNGLIVINGEQHKRLRKAATPAFKLSNLKGVMPIIEMCGQRMLNLFSIKCQHQNRGIDDRGQLLPAEVDIKEVASKTTLDIIGLIGFGYDFEEACSFKTGTFGCDMREWLDIKLSMFSIFPFWLQMAYKRLTLFLARHVNLKCLKLARTTNKIHNLVDTIVSKQIEAQKKKAFEGRKLSLTHKQSLLDFILDSPESACGGVDQQEIHDLLMTFLIAGHETSSLAVTWTLYLLSTHEHYQNRCREEAQTFFLNHSTNNVQWDDLKQLTFISAVVHESLRLYPPIPWLNRKSVDSDVIAGHHIPPNTDTVTIMLEAQRNADYWPNPDQFLPERFLEPHDSIPWDCFMPFGDGVHKCIGYQLALTEIIYLIAILVDKFRFAIENPEKYREFVIFTMQLKPNLKLLVTKFNKDLN